MRLETFPARGAPELAEDFARELTTMDEPDDETLGELLAMGAHHWWTEDEFFAQLCGDALRDRSNRT